MRNSLALLFGGAAVLVSVALQCDASWAASQVAQVDPSTHPFTIDPGNAPVLFLLWWGIRRLDGRLDALERGQEAAASDRLRLANELDRIDADLRRLDADVAALRRPDGS